MTKQINKSSTIFKHIAKGRNANNTFAKSLKSSLFSKTSRLTFFIFLFVTSTTQQTRAQIHPPPPPTTTGFQSVNVNNNNPIINNRPTSIIPNQYLQEQKKLSDQHKQIDLIKEEVTKHNNYLKKRTVLIDTNKYNAYKLAFENALQQLKTLNANNPNPSLSDAFYITENAFGNPYLSKNEYDNIIDKSASFIKQWMKQNNLDENDNEAKHLAIQKFMSEKLTIGEAVGSKEKGISVKTSQHLPFFYDYIDYEAKQDHRNFFLTKCLATGGGQCNSMPMVYLVLAERLNAKTFLAFAPQHSFIKYPKNNGEIENYEATSNWHINDNWYKDNLFISRQAITTGIYLDTLSKQKIVANCMLDLAQEYIRKMPIDNGKFLQNCLREAYNYYPKQNNIYSYFIYAEYLKGLMQLALGHKEITDINAIKNDEYTAGLQKEYQKNEAYIKEMGYRDMPESAYEDILKQHQFKGTIQKKYKITGKQKRNLFLEMNQ